MTDSASRSATTKAPTPDRRGRHVVGSLLLVSVVVAAALAAWYATRPDETAFEPSETAFDFDQHTLCDWFTADDMERIVAEAQARAEFDYQLESFATSGACRMLRTPAVAIWDTPGWQGRAQSSGGLGITLAPVDADPRREVLRGTDPADFEPHPQLDDRITFGNVSFTYGMYPGVQAQLRVVGHEDEVLHLGLGVQRTGTGLRADSPEAVDFGLIVADLMLEHMNWTD